jgi:uncharacterized protein
MDPIYIPQLIKAPEQTTCVEVKECLPGLETLTPVQGKLQLTHAGSYLSVSAQVETIITLTCDRCLQQYNHRLVTQASELIWLETTPQPDSIPLASETLTSSTSPDRRWAALEALKKKLRS